MKQLKKCFILALFCFLLFNPACAFDKINYEIDMTRPDTHFFEVAMRVDNINQESLDILIPRMTPGTYHHANYAKDVQEFSAYDNNQKPLKWEKIDLHTWRVYANKSNSMTVKYRVYGSNISIMNSFLNSRLAFIYQTSLLMYIKNKEDLPCVLNLKYPREWKAATTLDSPAQYSYTAPTYHYLVDRPILLGDIKEVKFKYKDAEYIIVLDGALIFDVEEFAANVKKIAKAEIDMMNGVPFKKYMFFYLYNPHGGGGLEHLDCAVMAINPYWSKGLKGLYGLTAHEFFHLWNDKCIYAKNIYPFRYNKTDYTRLYWFLEGFTSYYDSIIIARCGIETKEEFYESLSHSLYRILEDIPSVKYISAKEASFTGFYFRPQNYKENMLDFYAKGELIALVMDLEIRHKTQNKKSLDDVMRYMYKNYGLKNKGIAEDEMEEIFKKATGADLKDIFKDYVENTKEIKIEKYLNYAGLKLEVKEKNIGSYLGISCRYGNNGVEIEYIERNSPADKAGLSIGDIIIAANGVMVDERNFMRNFKPYEKIDITLFRNNVLMTKAVFPDKKGDLEYKIVEIKNPDKLQKEILKSWLGG